MLKRSDTADILVPKHKHINGRNAELHLTKETTF